VFGVGSEALTVAQRRIRLIRASASREVDVTAPYRIRAFCVRDVDA
jgi:hypothetical protein